MAGAMTRRIPKVATITVRAIKRGCCFDRLNLFEVGEFFIAQGSRQAKGIKIMRINVNCQLTDRF
jgi:hypothetical protein